MYCRSSRSESIVMSARTLPANKLAAIRQNKANSSQEMGERR